MTAEWLLLAVGVVIGWWASRAWTEAGVARHAMRRAWRGRKDWRRK
jgi:hypothetical protein